MSPRCHCSPSTSSGSRPPEPRRSSADLPRAIEVGSSDFDAERPTPCLHSALGTRNSALLPVPSAPCPPSASTPSPTSLPDLRGHLAIIIDLLRASTTITHALAAGASAVAPCESIEKARDLAATLPPNTYLLGGERQGLRIAGFDLGNSPTEYTPAKVKNKTIVFTTTNGTIALHRAESAHRILIGSFANLSAVTKSAADSHLPIHLICAGIHGQPCREDTLCAEAIAAALTNQGLTPHDADTRSAITLWNSIPPTPTAITQQLRLSEGGQNLISANLDSDIPICAQIDSRPIVPEWDSSRRILRT